MFDSITPRAHGVPGTMIVWGMACVAATLAAVMFITAFPAH
jgi:hypothetical protein